MSEKTETLPESDAQVILNTIVQSAHMGYWDWHIQTNYEYMSPGFKSMLGYSDNEIPNTPEWWQENIHPDDLPGVMTAFEAHVKSKGAVPYDNEVRYFHKDGSIVWVYCRGEVIEWDETGKPLRMVGSHIDITALKQAQQSLEKAKEDYRKKAEELSQFNNDMVGRELRMIELKKEVNELLIANGQNKKYTIYN
jgi:PAS domain S-box-containing protein